MPGFYTNSDERTTLPEIHAIEAEQAILGCILVNNDAYTQIMDRLTPDHFFEPVHSRIFEAVGDLIAAGRPALATTLAPQFRDDESLKPIGGMSYLAKLMGAAVTVVNAPGYAEMIVDTWARRQTLATLSDLYGDLSKPGELGAGARIKSALAEISEIAEPVAKGARAMLSKTVDGVLNRIQDKITNGTPVKLGVTTGSADLDKAVGLLGRGELVIIGARPSMGKTTVAESLLLRSALAGSGVMYFSMEMKGARLAERALADLAYSYSIRIEYRDIANGSLEDHQFARLCQSRELFDNLNFVIDERPKLSMMQIRASALREKRRLSSLGKNLDVIVIDHMGLVLPSQNYRGNKVAETEEISGECKVLAKDLDCCVVALIQLNRGVESRDEKRPTLADLRWSGAIEQDGDVVMFVYRDAYYLERQHGKTQAEQIEIETKLNACRNKIELIVAKNREGGCPTIEMMTDIGCGVVRDMERVHNIELF